MSKKKMPEHWTISHDPEELIKPTHQLVDIYDITFGSGCGILEENKAKWNDIMRLGSKETDTSTRWSIQDGTLFCEIVWWDDDISLQFAFNVSIKQAKRILADGPNHGIWVVGRKNLILGGVRTYSIDDLHNFLSLKIKTDLDPNRPNTWKVG